MSETQFFQLEEKKELSKFSTSEIAHSLAALNGYDIETALLMAYFVNRTSEPDMDIIVSDYVTESSKEESFSKLPILNEELMKEMKAIYDSNRLTEFKSNFSLL